MRNHKAKIRLTLNNKNETGNNFWCNVENMETVSQMFVYGRKQAARKEDAMIESDTIKLLRECDAGIKMGVSSIDEVLGYVHDERLRKCLEECKTGHEKLKDEIQTLLEKYHDDGKEPNPMAKGMSWIKTNVKLVMDESDKTISDLMTDGCNMGVKSLNKYLNQYKAADEKTKDITKRLIKLEEELTDDIKCYL